MLVVGNGKFSLWTLKSSRFFVSSSRFFGVVFVVTSSADMTQYSVRVMKSSKLILRLRSNVPFVVRKLSFDRLNRLFHLKGTSL